MNREKDLFFTLVYRWLRKSKFGGSSMARDYRHSEPIDRIYEHLRLDDYQIHNHMKYPNRTNRNIHLVFNRIFIAGLLILALNDHYLKQQYGNWLTGKLSDFAGLLIFPMFLQFLFPQLSKWSVIITGLFFIFWKLPVSENFIQFYNKIAFISISRTVDYSDFIALCVLPLSWYLIQRIDQYRIKIPFPMILRYTAIVPIVVIFMATQPSIKQRMFHGGDIHIGKYYRLKMSEAQALSKLKAQGYEIIPDTSKSGYLGKTDGYIINNLVLDGGKDTIESLQFAFLKTRNNPYLLINNIKLKPGDKVKNLKVLKRCYQKLIKADIVEELR